MKLKAPFPYFGGKSRIAAEVWRRFGDVKTYVEPFCGSCAVLLARCRRTLTTGRRGFRIAVCPLK
jgi:site-specific DNA-adenine methylase